MFSRALSVLALFAVVVIPELSFAQSWIDELVREASSAAEGRSGTVIMENHSSVSTGGKVVGSGGSSASDGDVSASSRSETYINVGSQGGEAQVKVETSRNGVTETRTYEKDVGAGEPMRLDVSARTDENGSEVKVVSKSEEGDEEALESRAPSSTDESTFAFVHSFESTIKSVSTFFAQVFTFFWGW